MENKILFEKIIRLMDEECEVLDNYLDSAEHLKKSLNCRNWNKTGSSIKHMEGIAVKIGELEETRITLVSSIGGKLNLNQILRKTDSTIRQRYNQKKNELKSRLLSVKARSQCIGNYAETQSRLGQAIMEGLIPGIKGKIYDGRGHAAVGTRNAVILSRYL